MNPDASARPPGPDRFGQRSRAGKPPVVDGERRVITILFCDVVGSTNLAGQLDPEEWAEVMNEAFHYMIAPIEEYDGMVARLMGDAVLAFFGAPHAHEDDPQRAVLAGLGIISGIQGFARRFREEYGLEFTVRVGINTGPVVVGEIGSQLNQEYTAMGDAINLAARMEQTAIAGSVQISDDTYRLVAPYFDTWDIGPVEVKGKDEPVQAYRVLGLEPQPGRSRGIDGISAPVIGRDRELSRLREIIDDLRAGQSQVVFLIGEAGLGKSRLIAEAREMWRSDPSSQISPEAQRHIWTEFLAVSYGASRPYDMIKRQLRQLSNLRETDTQAAVHERLDGLFTMYPDDLQGRMHDYYGYLLGDSQTNIVADGEAFQRELHGVLVDAAADLGNQGPLVYVVDDTHWADLASLAAVRQLLTLVPRQPILFLFAMRPDWNSAAWQFHMEVQQAYNAYCSSIFLEPLVPQDSRRLIVALLEEAGAPEQLFDLVQDKAEGNPYYMEEVVRSLIDSGALARQDGQLRWQVTADLGAVDTMLSLPGNVQSLLTARFDRLDKGAQRTIQLASVIGRSFPLRVLEAIAGAELDVADQVARLIQSDLIRQTATAPEPEYTFLHALTLDAAYETILHRQRRRIHRQVAEAFETLYPNRLEEEAPRIAFHFAEGRDWAKAVAYYTMAAEAAARLYANDEALEHFEQAIDLTLTAPTQPITDHELIELFLKRSRILEVSSRLNDAQEQYVRLQSLGEAQDNNQMIATALAAQATLRVTPTPLLDAEEGRRLAEQALSLADEHGFRDVAARAHWALMLFHLNLAWNPEAALKHAEQALAIARELKLGELEAFVLNDIPRAYFGVGRFKEEFEAFAAARTAWEKLGNKAMLTDLLSTWSHALLLDGEFALAEARAREGLALSRELGNSWGLAYNYTNTAISRLEQGDMGESLALLLESLQISEDAGLGIIHDHTRLILWWYQLRLGAPESRWKPPVADSSPDRRGNADKELDRLWYTTQALAAGRVTEAWAHSGPTLVMLNLSPHGILGVLAYVVQTSVALRSGAPADAAILAREALSGMEGQGVKLLRPDLLNLLGQAEIELDHNESAREAWVLAEEIAREKNVPHALVNALANLATLDDDERRTAHLGEAKRIVQSIAASFSSLELRATYLAQPRLATILRSAGDF